MLKDLINRLYSDNIDMKAIIEAIQPELDMRSETLQGYSDDTFAKRATLDGILQWEIILGIVADPSIEPLQFRRERVLNRLASNTPFTERALQSMMNNIMGADAWAYSLDYNNYTLDIVSLRPGNNWVREVITTLESIMPANIVWTVNLYAVNWQAVNENYANWGEVYSSNKTWQEIMEGV